MSYNNEYNNFNNIDYKYHVNNKHDNATNDNYNNSMQLSENIQVQ